MAEPISAEQAIEEGAFVGEMLMSKGWAVLEAEIDERLRAGDALIRECKDWDSYLKQREQLNGLVWLKQFPRLVVEAAKRAKEEAASTQEGDKQA